MTQSKLPTDELAMYLAHLREEVGSALDDMIAIK